MKHIPNKIYLQIGEDCDAEDFKDLNEVTWCQVEIHSNDIEYVRSSQQPENEVWDALESAEMLLRGGTVPIKGITWQKIKAILSKRKEEK